MSTVRCCNSTGRWEKISPNLIEWRTSQFDEEVSKMVDDVIKRFRYGKKEKDICEWRDCYKNSFFLPWECGMSMYYATGKVRKDGMR